MNVKNKGCIRNISLKQLKAAKTRNLVAIVAIALTTLLFTSLFTVAMSLNASYEEYTFRQIGGSNHGTFKDVDERQIEALSGHKKVKAYGLRTVCGFAMEVPFAKIPAEISWMDANCTKWSYATPTTGRMPKSGMEIAMDTEALRKLGVPAELGQRVELTYLVDSKDASIESAQKRTDVFTLVGFWNYDSLMPVHYINVSRAYVKQVEADSILAGRQSFRTDMNVMLSSPVNIRSVMESIELDLGYQWEYVDKENCVRIGTNWGYTSAQLETNIDLETLGAIAAFLLLVIFTGYLIIYNIFQISVGNDIRFYGLLKTIGTTPKQLKRIVRQQAFYLSVIGIPVGCALGYVVGALLMPKLISTSLLTTTRISTSPLIFVGAALFALFTVWLSCTRPGKKAAGINPVEAVRYTEGTVGAGKKRATRGAKVRQMAFANLGRNKTKTALVIVSLSLAVVLLSTVVLFVGGFDIEKYVSSFSVADFIVGTTDYFRYSGRDTGAAISDEQITDIRERTNAGLGGAVYSVSGYRPSSWLTEEELCSITGPISEEMLQPYMDQASRRGELLEAQVLLDGLDEPLLDKLLVYEGNLEPLLDPTQNAIALSANLDEHGEIYSVPKRVGETLTITYVDEGRFFDSRTGEPVTENTPVEYWEYRVMKTHDTVYTVCALVGIPYGMSHRFSVSNGFEAILTSDALRRECGENCQRMIYLFDTPDEASETEAEAFLASYTAGEDPGLMYESKALLRADFENFRNIFLLVGSTLSLIVGLIGVLNFCNAILTGIITRKREFAVLQSIGMTGKQLKTMLVYEGLFYAVGAVVLSLLLTVVLSPLTGSLLTEMFWFFSYHFTVTPILLLLPFFVLLGTLVPLVVYHASAKATIVERLREAEA